MAKTSSAVKNKYNEKAYDRVIIIVPKGRKSELKAHAEIHGYKSLNEFIVSAINDKIKIEKGCNI